VARKAKDGGRDPQFGRDERHADRAAQRHAPEPDRSTRANAVEFLDGIQGRMLLGNGQDFTRQDRAFGVVA
jgi:hypothetical protein